MELAPKLFLQRENRQIKIPFISAPLCTYNSIWHNNMIIDDDDIYFIQNLSYFLFKTCWKN